MKKIINTQELINLYKKGLFPMANSSMDEDINFYLPIKRFIIPINSFHIPKKLFTQYKKKKFNFTINKEFITVINSCAYRRKPNQDTWINEIIKDTYIQLFKEGYGKSIECFYDKELVGGLYGIHIGGAFFGESMFSTITNTSKLCLMFLISILKKNNFILLDSQFYNQHLTQFGAYEILNKEYQEILKKSLKKNCEFPSSFSIQKSILTLQLLSHKS